MKDTFDIFSEGFPDLKKTAGRFVAYTLLFIWTIKKQVESIDEIVTTFFYWFFLVSLVLAIVSFIGFVFFAIGYRDYLKSDSDLMMLDWPKRVKLFNKVGLDKSVAVTVFIYTVFTFLVIPFQSLFIDNEPLTCVFLVLIGFIAIGALYLCASWEDTYKLMDREVHALDTNKQLLLRDKEASWNKRDFFCHTKIVILSFIVMPLIFLFLLFLLPL